MKFHKLHYYVIYISIKVEESSFVSNTRNIKSGKVECGNGSLCKYNKNEEKTIMSDICLGYEEN